LPVLFEKELKEEGHPSLLPNLPPGESRCMGQVTEKREGEGTEGGGGGGGGKEVVGGWRERAAAAGGGGGRERG